MTNKEPVLTKDARVGNVIFRKGLPQRLVIEAAERSQQRWVDNPELDKRRIEQGELFIQSLINNKPDEDSLTIKDYEEVLADNKRLVLQLSKLLFGASGSANPSLCDIVSVVRRERLSIRDKVALKRLRNLQDRTIIKYLEPHRLLRTKKCGDGYETWTNTVVDERKLLENIRKLINSK